MDILYIIGRGSKWNNNELRYSLRSIATNGINVGRVFIAGYIPEFINTDEVTVLPVEDTTKVKHHNIQNAIEQAVKHLDLSENFLYSSDDHYYIKPTDFDNYPFYWRGRDLPERVKPGEQHAIYHTTLASTRKLLAANGLPYFHFAWHGNTHFNTRLFKSKFFQRLLRAAYKEPEGCEPTCLMLNYWLSVEPFEMTKREDLKIQPYETYSTILNKTTDREVCSTADKASNGGFKEFLEQLFPVKCKYEK